MATLTKERFLDICRFKRRGDLSLIFHLLWPATKAEWVKQGAPKSFNEPGSPTFGADAINDFFKFESTRWLKEIDSGPSHGNEYRNIAGSDLLLDSFLLSPPYEVREIEEDDRTMTLRNPCNQTIKVFKQNSINMPMFLDWPVKDRATWEEVKKRLDPTTPARYPADWDAYVREINDSTEPVMMEVGGFFGPMREWVGSERVLYMFYDDPGLVEDIMDTILYMEMEIVKRVSKDIKLDVAFYWEDMAFKGGPLISPDMFRKFMMPRYKKLNELLDSIGVDIRMVDCDGNIDLLIPLWLECGVNYVWPLEVAAGNDAVANRKKYGEDLIMGGGIDKRALVKGKDAIKKEVMSKVPFLLEKGGYFPSVDHLIPPDVPFENFCYYINLMREIGGLEKLPF